MKTLTITSMIPAPVGWRAVQWGCEHGKEGPVVYTLPVIGWAVTEDSCAAAAVVGGKMDGTVIDTFVADDGFSYNILGYLQPGEVFDEPFWLGLAEGEVHDCKVAAQRMKEKRLALKPQSTTTL